MSFDEDKRRAERAAWVDGDERAEAEVNHSLNRMGEGRLAMLRRYVGRWVYVEGARMNYVGILAGVTSLGNGDPAELLWERVWRMGDWNRTGPLTQNAMELTIERGLPQWTPWNAVDGFGLAPAGWSEWIAQAQ